MTAGDRVQWITTAGDMWTGTVVAIRGDRVQVSQIWTAAGELHNAGRRASISADRLRPAVTMHTVRMPVR